MKKMRWRMRPLPKASVVEELRREINVRPFIAQLLAQRGIKSFDEAQTFFTPNLDQLHDPFLMAGLSNSVDRILEAIENQERVLIYGDYDVDGTSSVALMYRFLSRFSENLECYIPDRYSEGYGVSMTGMQFAADNEFDLLITLDCGIKATQELEWVTEQGIDVIVVDHHRPGRDLPKVYSVIDPKRPDCQYPFKELCAAGVAFKLIQAVHQKQGGTLEEMDEWLDMVAVATLSDIVPMTGENRVLTALGMRRLNTKPSPGLNAFVSLAKVEGNLNSIDVLFKVSPKINAAGRMEHGRLAVDLLIENDAYEALEMAKVLEKHNTARRESDQLITVEALEQIEEQIADDAYSTVVYRPDWHKGVIGIVASRLIERHYRPTIVLTESNGLLAGSARSVLGFDVYDAINECSEYLEQFGGHMYAAGMTMKPEKLEVFKTAFERVVAERIEERQRTPEIEIDLELDLEDINIKLMNILNRMEPYGPENPVPVFCVRNVRAMEDSVQQIGKEGSHLKLMIGSRDSYRTIAAIGFGMGSLAGELMTGRPFHLVFELGVNSWRGTETLQMMIKDLEWA